MQKPQRQMPAQAGREVERPGEASPEIFSDEALFPRNATGDTGSALLQSALTTDNLRRVFKRVRANKEDAGVDGLNVNQSSRLLATAWLHIREQLMAGTYRPKSARWMTIPKPDGGERELGIATMTDRLFQQALLRKRPPSGQVFVFRGRRGDLIKVRRCTGDGLCLLCKRLKRGRFIWPQASSGSVSRAQLSMLVEGIDSGRPERALRAESAL
jgi:hypothetical protein